MQSIPAPAELSAKCDWFTRTFSDPKIREFVYDDYQIAADILQLDGHEPSSWQWMGYEGMSIAGLTWGHREDGDIVRCTGGLAERMFSRFCNYQGNTSRLDVAVTMSWGKPQRYLATDAYAYICSQRPEESRRTYSLIVNSKGGETLYVGSRSSDQFGRLYDKSAEQGKSPIGREWRYEVEFKKERAVRALELLQNQRDRRKMYLGLVASYFVARGVALPTIEEHTPYKIELADPPRSVETQLAWLRRQVQPVVSKLQRAGLEDAVIEALHLERTSSDGSTKH